MCMHCAPDVFVAELGRGAGGVRAGFRDVPKQTFLDPGCPHWQGAAPAAGPLCAFGRIVWRCPLERARTRTSEPHRASRVHAAAGSAEWACCSSRRRDFAGEVGQCGGRGGASLGACWSESVHVGPGPPTHGVVDVRGGSRSGVREGDAARSVVEWRVKRELGCVPLRRGIESVLTATVSVPWQASQGGSLNFEPCTGRAPGRRPFARSRVRRWSRRTAGWAGAMVEMELYCALPLPARRPRRVNSVRLCGGRRDWEPTWNAEAPGSAIANLGFVTDRHPPSPPPPPSVFQGSAPGWTSVARWKRDCRWAFGPQVRGRARVRSSRGPVREKKRCLVRTRAFNVCGTRSPLGGVHRVGDSLARRAHLRGFRAKSLLGARSVPRVRKAACARKRDWQREAQRSGEALVRAADAVLAAWSLSEARLWSAP